MKLGGIRPSAFDSVSAASSRDNALPDRACSRFRRLAAIARANSRRLLAARCRAAEVSAAGAVPAPAEGDSGSRAEAQAVPAREVQGFPEEFRAASAADFPALPVALQAEMARDFPGCPAGQWAEGGCRKHRAARPRERWIFERLRNPPEQSLPRPRQR
jgi:hypothetical protein